MSFQLFGAFWKPWWWITLELFVKQDEDEVPDEHTAHLSRKRTSATCDVGETKACAVEIPSCAAAQRIKCRLMQIISINAPKGH